MGCFGAASDSAYRMVESVELVVGTSEFLGCHEHECYSLTWPLKKKRFTKVSECY